MGILIKGVRCIGELDGIHDIYVHGNKIAGIDEVPDGFIMTNSIDGKNKLLLPGLINCHTHTYMSLFRNAADDLSFLDWLFGHIDPLEGKMEPEDAYWGSMLSVVEMIKSGTTCFCDMHMHPEQTVRAVDVSGLRAVITRGLVGGDREDEGGIRRLNEAKDELAHWREHPRLSFRLGPHAPYTCGEDYLKYVKEQSEELGIGLRLPDPGGLVLCGNLIREALCLKMAREAAMEEMRTLYVAMTRAKERLIVTANTNVSPEEELSRAEKLSRFTDEYQVLHASRMIDIILRSLATDSRAKPIYTVIHKDTELERGESVSFEEKTAELSASPEEISRIRRNIGFVYPGAHMVNIPSKLSVSALYPTILDGEDESVSLTLDGEAVAGGDRAKVEREAMPRPRFMTGEAAVSGADRGTATHVFLQFADMERVRRDGVKRELERLVECGFVTAGMAALVNRAQAEHFAFSGIVTRMLASRKCMREFRFNVRLPAENFTDDEALKAVLAEGGEKLTVQGVFDCVFEDGDGKLVLVDYKTDYITPEEMNNREAAYRKLRERHSRQLGYYKEAVRLIFGRYPDETYLYSLPLGETVSI